MCEGGEGGVAGNQGGLPYTPWLSTSVYNARGVSSYPAISVGEEVSDTPSSSSSLVQEQPSCRVCVCVFVCMVTHGHAQVPVMILLLA